MENRDETHATRRGRVETFGGNDPYETMAYRVLVRAVRDWQSLCADGEGYKELQNFARGAGYPSCHEELLAFFHSEACALMCAMLRISPDRFFARLDVPSHRSEVWYNGNKNTCT